jgi:hypothetical protein
MSAESTKQLFSDIFKDNPGTMVALGATVSGAFGIGYYNNLMRVVEEQINALSEEKINFVMMGAKKDALLVEERAKIEALEHLYKIFT